MKMVVYITSTDNREVIDLVKLYDNVGIMATPSDYRLSSRRQRHAIDNGAFTAYANGTCFDDGVFLKALKNAKQGNPDFVVLPDIVAGGKKSLKYSAVWREFLPDCFSWYLAAQDGITAKDIPTDMIKKIMPA